jgi:hypothetical protein
MNLHIIGYFGKKLARLKDVWLLDEQGVKSFMCECHSKIM